MKNNFKFLIVLVILLTACICIGSTFAADVSVNDIDNTTDLEIAHDDSSQKAVELNNLHVEKTSFNQDNDIVSLNSDNRADVDGHTFEDIQNSITSSNMEIYLHNQTYTGSSQININYDNITIYGGNSATDGLSSTLDAQGLCRIMYLSNSVKTITFVNIKFINGNAYNGGAIYVNSSVTIPNTGFVENNVTISAFNISFVGNNATSWGGAIYARNEITVISEGIYSEVIPGSICISGVNTSFINNNATTGGGAIYSYNSNMTINGTDTKFIGNFANMGGAIDNFIGRLCISGVNTSFINNNATAWGGAIYVDTPSNTIASLCISGVNTIFRGNAAGSGGAIVSYNSNVTINGNDTKFINNSANSDTRGTGGAIYMYKGGSLCISGVNTSFIDNYANNSNNSFGGAICTDPVIMYISGVNTSFTGNRACYGGAIYVSGDNYTIEGSIFINNNASYDVYAGERGGGAIYIAGNYTTLKNCTFINNTASGLGIEGSYHGTDGGSAVLVSGNNNTIDSCIFINNTVLPANGNYTGDEGGAVFIYANYTTLKNCTFNNNDAPCAGAVFVCGNYTMIEWCNFTNNVAVGNGTFDGGGAIYLYTSSSTGLSNCTIINCNFINNSVNGSTSIYENKTTDAGAIYSNMDYVTISYSYFEGNFAQKGGAIRMHGKGDNPIYNCSFTGNRAVERGGAVYLADSIFRNLTDCNFTNNSVIGSKSFGGAINIQLGMINNCNFINNSARYGCGGAIMWDHTYAATEDGGFANNCTFIQNTAHQGSAIYFDNVVNSTTLTNVSFINNTADSKEINIDCNQSEDSYTFIITHYGFNNILDAIYFKCSNSPTKNITINNVTYYPSNEDALKTNVVTNVTFICLEGNETLRIDSGHPYVLNTSNSTYKHPIKVIATYDGPLYSYISNFTSFNYETEISIGDFSGLTLSNVTSTVNIHIKGDSNATINNTKVNVTLSFKDLSKQKGQFQVYYHYYDVDVIDGKMTLPLPTLTIPNNVTADLKIEFNGNSTYNASNGTTTLNISKRETPMNVSVISDHGNFVFDVILPENATGKIYFSVRYFPDNSSNLTDGIAHFNITYLTPGNYTSMVKYDGDDYFKSNYPDFNFTVYGDYSSIEANVSSHNLSLGDNLTVYGTVYGNLSSIPTGNVTICLSNGENYTVTIDGEGNFSYSISGLNAGNYSITVKYNGDSNYSESSTNLTDIIVNQGNPTVNVVINPDIISFGDNVTITGNVTGLNDIIPTGNVTILVNGTEIANKTLTDGKFSYSISDLNAGFYNITVHYNGDSNYNSTQNSTNVTVVPRNIKNIDIDFDNINYGENATVNVTVNGLDGKAPTGNVTIKVDGNEIANITLNDGKCNCSISNLTGGNHTITVVYNGDNNYVNTQNSTQLTVNPTSPTYIGFDINDTYYGHAISGNAVVYGLDGKAVPSGNITIFVDGKEIETKTLSINGAVYILVGGLAAGKHNVTVHYLGDNNYLAMNNSTIVTITQVTPYISITVDDINYTEDAVVNINVTKPSYLGVLPTGNVTIFVNGSEVATVDLIDGVCTYNITGLVVGDYNITARYNGDINYTSIENSTDLTVIPKNITILTFINETVYSDNLTGNINTNLTNKSGNISVIINGTVYNGTVGPDGSFILNNTDSLNAGHYGYCPVSFISADGNYIAEDDCAFNIIRKNITIDATINNITYGDNLSGSVNADLSGRISIYPGDGNFSYEFDTIGPFTTEWEYMLGAGTYEAGIIFLSDNGNYQGFTTVLYTINKTNSTITIDVDDIVYGENVNVNGTVIGLEDVTIPTGNVTILVNNTEIANVTLVDGKFNCSIPNLASGDYNITVLYNGDNNYNSSESSANVTVSPVSAQGINITVNIPEYGDDAVVNVTVVGLDGKAVPSGNVTIFVNGTEYANRTLTDGKCNCSIPNLNIGDYNITVIYNGDNNYTSIENSTILTVIPKDINMGAIIYNGTYGDESISGVVNASMNGTVYVQVVPGCTPLKCSVNESGEFTVPVNLVAGDYPNAYVSFLSADGNYMGGSNVSFNIAKAEPQVTVDIGSNESFEIKFGDTVVAIVGVPDDATGIVYFSLDNKTWTPITIPEDTNLVEYDIPSLDAGNYILFVKYSGDNNYNPVYSENPFSVDQLNTIVSVDSVKGKAGEKVKITARVTDENGNPVQDGTIIIGFNGKEYKANVVNGIATVEVVLPNKAGNYSATAYYEGFNYNSSYTTFTVEVSDIPGPNPDPNPINPVGNMENTGNPILVLLIALCAIGLESFRRKF